MRAPPGGIRNLLSGAAMFDRFCRGGVTFLSPNKKVNKEVGFPGAELIAPAIKAAPVPRPLLRECSIGYLSQLGFR